MNNRLNLFNIRGEQAIEEIKNLPHSSNILLKEFAPVIHSEFQKILSDAKTSLNQENGEKNEAGKIPF